MGFPKVLRDDSPIVIIDGTVYQYGRVKPNAFFETPEPEWVVEHHSLSKPRHSFGSEQELTDFIDGLPESDDPPFAPDSGPYWRHDQNGLPKILDPGGWGRELEAYQDKLRIWRRELAARKRRERAEQPAMSPRQRYVENCRNAINAILDKHLCPIDDWDPGIPRQVMLVLRYELKTYRQAVGWEPSPSNDEIARADPRQTPDTFGIRECLRSREPANKALYHDIRVVVQKIVECSDRNWDAFSQEAEASKLTPQQALASVIAYAVCESVSERRAGPSEN